MTLTKRLRAFFFPDTETAPAVASLPDTFRETAHLKTLRQQPETELMPGEPVRLPINPAPLPDWLADEEGLRDEGVLFGLSDARPDGKIAQIRAYFGQQSVSFDELINQYTETVSEFNLLIEQRENRINVLRDQVNDLRHTHPASHLLIRNTVSLVLSVVLCVGNFYLIDETLRPAFPNRWIPVGVFLAGMFNLFGRTSFFYETGTRLTTRRLVEELGLPLATSVFVFVYGVQSQGIWQAVGLWMFVFFLFLLAGKLLLSTLTALQTDLTTIQANRRLMETKVQDLPGLEAELDRLNREIDGIRAQRWPILKAMNQAETERARLNTQRDRLVNLFISEFELTRSLRDRITEQQRNIMMNYE